MFEHLALIGHEPSDRFADIEAHAFPDGREAGQYGDRVETRSASLGDLVLGNRKGRREAALLQGKAERDERVKVAQRADRCQD
jgi:hypothetical protein